jgi:hypothetical protein
MNSRKLRILFRFLNITKSFYWLEYKDLNLYWGTSTKSILKKNEGEFRNLLINAVSGDPLLDEPLHNNLKQIKYNKFSYHKSGEAHNREILIDGSHKQPYSSQWIEFKEINSTELFFAVLTRPIYLYDDYKGDENKCKSSSLIITLDKQYLKNRSIIEFYITPKNTFTPISFFLTDNQIERNIFELDERYDLVVRSALLNNKNHLNEWHVDKEFVFIKTLDS